MNTDKLVDQLELYSNAIVAFTVAQSVGFSFTFGTSADFSCAITSYRLLSAGLVAHFILGTLLAAWAILYIRARIHALSGENASILGTVYWAKAVVCAVFAIIPIGLLLSFGVLGDPSKGRCVKLLKTSLDALLQGTA